MSGMRECRDGSLRSVQRFAGAALALTLVATSVAFAGRGGGAEEGSARELAGLWAARRDFGPEVRGPVSLREVAGRLEAEISGYTVSARVSNGGVRFEIPGDRGYFRGRLSGQDRVIRGHWVQPRAFRSFSRMASPVTLEPTGTGLWTGTVTPLHDQYHFYLVIEKREDGGVGAFLRNPEANIGRFYPIAQVVRDGDTVRFLDSDGRTRLTGQYDGAFDRLSVYFPLNGGTYDFARVDRDLASSFLPRPSDGEPYRYRTPLSGEGWEAARPEDVGMTVAPLEQMIRMIVATPMDAIDAPYIHGILVARRGRLVLEEYFHGYSRHQPHGTRSASKSITATLVGVAAHEGILDLARPVYETLYDGSPPEELDPRARRMTVEHLITMTSGLACDDWDPDSPGGEDVMQSQDDEPDWHRFTLGLPVIHAPGEHPAYCSGGMSLAGGVVSHAAGEWLPDYYREQFAEPLESGVYHMNLTPTGKAYGGGGLYIKPRDFLKLGQLYLDDGVWNGRRLLAPGWAEAATKTAGNIGDEGYGHGWWVFSYPFGDREVRAFYAGGNGGQYVIVVPELDLNVVIFGGNYNQQVMHRSKYEYVRDYVLEAIEATED